MLQACCNFGHLACSWRVSVLGAAVMQQRGVCALPEPPGQGPSTLTLLPLLCLFQAVAWLVLGWHAWANLGCNHHLDFNIASNRHGQGVMWLWVPWSGTMCCFFGLFCLRIALSADFDSSGMQPALRCTPPSRQKIELPCLHYPSHPQPTNVWAWCRTSCALLLMYLADLVSMHATCVAL